MKLPACGIITLMVPRNLRLLFWDTNVDNFDPITYPRYTIERVLEYGDEMAVDWMRGIFTHEQILDVLRTGRNLTPLSANFWTDVTTFFVSEAPRLARLS